MAPKKLKVDKAYIKFLGNCNNPKLLKAVFGSVVRFCPESVIQGVCNAALNVAEGDTPLTSSQKKQLRQHRKQIEILISKNKSIASKRKLLQKGRGLFSVIPTILSIVLEALGARFLPQ